MEEMVTIRKKEYNSLINDSLLLRCLHDAGVDNWGWYGDAYHDYIVQKGDEEC